MSTIERPRENLVVAAAQWMAVPGDADANLTSALEMIERAAAGGADLVLLPELWISGYDTASLASDVKAAAEPLLSPRTSQLADAARRLGIWLFAGSVPELSEGLIYNTAPVFNRSGALVARHRKVHLYRPTGEDKIFAAGTELTSFVDDELGHIGVTLCFDGDFPETARALGQRGVDLIIQANAYEWEARSYWDLLYPAAALANAQWWVMANQCGTTPSGTCLGGSRVIAPTGDVLAEASRAIPGENPEPELLLYELKEPPETAGAREFAQLLREA
jgi:predicted amidohydrolase